MNTRPLTADERTLVEKNLGLVHHVVNRRIRGAPTLERLRDDMLQAGCMALISAVTGYDAGRGATFSGFTGVEIERAVSDFLGTELSPVKTRRNGRTGKKPEVISVEVPEDLEAPTAPDRLDIGVVAQVLEHTRIHYTRHAPRLKHIARDMEVFRRIEADENGAAIARELGVTCQRIHQIADGVRRSFDIVAAEVRGEAA